MNYAKILKNIGAALVILPGFLFAMPLMLLMAAMDPPSERKKNGGYWAHAKTFFDFNIFKEP